MKLFVAIISVLLVGLVAGQTGRQQSGNGNRRQLPANEHQAAAQDVCFSSSETECGANPKKELECNSKFGGIDHAVSHLQSYINEQLVASYDYLLLSTFFNSYQRDRPGFEKLFRALSDQAFENSIKLIKHTTRRGGSADFMYHEENAATVAVEKNLDLDELKALSKALDMEKNLSKKAMHIHYEVSKHTQYDPEITQFLEEELLSKQASDVRKLSGFTNDLYKLMSDSSNNKPLSVYLFDEYLQKQ